MITGFGNIFFCSSICGLCEGDQSGALKEISQLNYTMEYVTTHLQEIPQRIRWGS